jgi:nicotinamidase-related amidase
VTQDGGRTGAAAVAAYRARYGLDGDLLPAGADGRDEAAVVAEAEADYELDRPDAFPVRAAECALLVIDMQSEFLTPGGPMWVPQAGRILPRLAEFADGCRALGVPVLLTEATYLRDHPNDTAGYCPPIAAGALREGSPGCRVDDSLVRPGDHVVRTKHTYNAFAGTELDSRLRGAAVRTVIVTGTLTNFCCEATARGAFDLGYHVVFVDDLTATDSALAHQATVRTLRRGYARVMRRDDLWAALSAACAPRDAAAR